jgi:hypothetical protein
MDRTKAEKNVPQRHVSFVWCWVTILTCNYHRQSVKRGIADTSDTNEDLDDVDFAQLEEDARQG